MSHGKPDQKILERFVASRAKNGNEIPRRPRSGAEGQALVEFALSIPLLFLLMVSALNFGGFISAWITIANAARTACQYGALGNASVGTPTVATSGSISSLIQSDTAPLKGTAPSVAVCLNNNGTVTKLGGGTCPVGVNAPQDPETVGGTGTATYTSVTVDVTYTYTPFFNSRRFLGFNISLPPTTLHRRTVMRLLN